MNYFLVSWLLLRVSLTALAQSAQVQLNLTGVSVGKGPIVVNLYDSAGRFFKEATYTKTVKDAQSSVTVSIELPAGRYAVSVFQDINRNKRLDQGWFKIPTEPVGFGNNFRPRASAPRFDDCAIVVKPGSNQFTINLFSVF